MTGQLCWMRVGESPRMILHVRTSSNAPWIPYYQSNLAVPDHLIPGGSKGFATAQHLLKQGFVYDQPSAEG